MSLVVGVVAVIPVMWSFTKNLRRGYKYARTAQLKRKFVSYNVRKSSLDSVNLFQFILSSSWLMVVWGSWATVHFILIKQTGLVDYLNVFCSEQTILVGFGMIVSLIRSLRSDQIVASTIRKLKRLGVDTSRPEFDLWDHSKR